MSDPIDSIRAELDALTDAGLRRVPPMIAGPQGASLNVDGRQMANFCSNDYLGLASHPDLAAGLREGSSANGVGSGASRLVAGSVEPHLTLEIALAEWLGAERALLFNSGYQANVGVVSALVGPDDAIFSDALNHASIIDGCQLSRASVHVYPHLDIDALESALSRSTARRKLVISESLFSMDGDKADIFELGRVARTHGALLVIDEAHAVGVQGEAGRGLAARGQADAVIGTFGKAFGTFGAFVAGRAAVIELLEQKARSFVFSTALPGVLSAASLASLNLIRAHEGSLRRRRLIENIGRFQTGLARVGIQTSDTQIQPLIVREGNSQRAVELARHLYTAGIFAIAIRPPTVPRGTSRIRVTLRSDHCSEQIDELVAQLIRFRELIA